MAGITTDVHASTAETVAHAVRVNRTYESNPKLQAQYAETTALYTEVHPALATGEVISR